jgi:hypothetical protein
MSADITSPELWDYDQSIATVIIIPNEKQLQRLKLKLLDYQGRSAYAPDLTSIDETTMAVHGFATLDNLIKRTVLSSVIDLAENKERDTLQWPISMAEVALQFTMRTGADVSDAISGPHAVPFIYDKDRDWHMPKFSPEYNEADSLPTLFAAAYGIVRAYAWNRLDVVVGGSGLRDIPEIPTSRLDVTE